MINYFRDKNAFLSNFFVLENPIKVGFLTFDTAEHFYQAHKTLDLNDRVWISGLETAAAAKKAGSKRGLNGRKILLREDWIDDKVKQNVMYTGMFLKFMNNYELASRLITTYPKKLIEGNRYHDNYWGDCHCDKCAHIKGKNNLGLLLMYLRNALITIKI